MRKLGFVRFRNRSAASILLRTGSIIARLAWVFFRRIPALGSAILRSSKNDQYRLVGEAFASAAESLGPVFIKAAQMISYRTDLLPEKFLRPLTYLQDKVKPESFCNVRYTVENSFGQPLEAIFRWIEHVPIGSGSIACVFRAETIDGHLVAVKVARRNINCLVWRDLAILGSLVRLFAKLSIMRGIPILETYEQIAEMIADQADMALEASHLVEFADITSHRTGVTLPQPLIHLVRPNILVMDYVSDAVPINNPSIPINDYKRGAIQVLNLLYEMIFRFGLVHCDMHPGNILISVGGSVNLIDAGLVARLSESDKRCFRDFFMALAFGDSLNCTETIVRAAICRPNTLNIQELQNDVAELIRIHHAKRVGDFLVAEFVYQVFAIQRRHGLYGTPGFVSAIWALVMFEGLVRQRYPELDFQNEAKPFMTGSIIDMIRDFNGTR